MSKSSLKCLKAVQKCPKSVKKYPKVSKNIQKQLEITLKSCLQQKLRDLPSNSYSYSLNLLDKKVPRHCNRVSKCLPMSGKGLTHMFLGAAKHFLKKFLIRPLLLWTRKPGIWKIQNGPQGFQNDHKTLDFSVSGCSKQLSLKSKIFARAPLLW